jgi:hypothetical protein
MANALLTQEIIAKAATNALNVFGRDLLAMVPPRPNATIKMGRVRNGKREGKSRRQSYGW